MLTKAQVEDRRWGYPQEVIDALLADLEAAARPGYRCLAHEGDVAEGRCVCCEAVQVAKLLAALEPFLVAAEALHITRAELLDEGWNQDVNIQLSVRRGDLRRAAEAGGKNNVIRE